MDEINIPIKIASKYNNVIICILILTLVSIAYGLNINIGIVLILSILFILLVLRIKRKTVLVTVISLKDGVINIMPLKHPWLSIGFPYKKNYLTLNVDSIDYIDVNLYFLGNGASYRRYVYLKIMHNNQLDGVFIDYLIMDKLCGFLEKMKNQYQVQVFNEDICKRVCFKNN